MTTLRDLSDHLPVVTHLLDALLAVDPWRPSLTVSRTRVGRRLVEAAPGDAYVTATDAASSRARDRARDAQLQTESQRQEVSVWRFRCGKGRRKARDTNRSMQRRADDRLRTGGDAR